MSNDFNKKYDNILPKETNLKGNPNIIYDNLSNINDYGFNGKFGTQFSIITFLNRNGNIDPKEVENNTFTLPLREPFKISLSTKSPVDSPLVTLSRKMINDNKTRCAYAMLGIDKKKFKIDSNGEVDENSINLTEHYTAYDPINLTDNYTLKLYSGTEHPTFNLNGRIYMDKSIYKNPHKDENNYTYLLNFIKKIVGCIVPSNEDNKKAYDNIGDKISNALTGAVLEKSQTLKLLYAASKLMKDNNNFSIDSIAKRIDDVNVDTYGCNIVCFSIPWLFGSVYTMGSTTSTEKEIEKDNEKEKVNVGDMLNMKCFLKHMDFKLSKDYYIEKTILQNKIYEFRFPSYVDINLTLEATQIPSVFTWVNSWLRTV